MSFSITARKDLTIRIAFYKDLKSKGFEGQTTSSKKVIIPFNHEMTSIVQKKLIVGCVFSVTHPFDKCKEMFWISY